MNINAKNDWRVQAMQHGCQWAAETGNICLPSIANTSDVMAKIMADYRVTLTVDGADARERFGAGLIGSLVADFLYGYAFTMGRYAERGGIEAVEKGGMKPKTATERLQDMQYELKETNEQGKVYAIIPTLWHLAGLIDAMSVRLQRLEAVIAPEEA